MGPVRPGGEVGVSRHATLPFSNVERVRFRLPSNGGREPKGPRNGEYKYKVKTAGPERGRLLEALTGVRGATQRSRMVTGVPSQKPPLLRMALGPLWAVKWEPPCQENSVYTSIFELSCYGEHSHKQSLCFSFGFLSFLPNWASSFRAYLCSFTVLLI